MLMMPIMPKMMARPAADEDQEREDVGELEGDREDLTSIACPEDGTARAKAGR